MIRGNAGIAPLCFSFISFWDGGEAGGRTARYILAAVRSDECETRAREFAKVSTRPEIQRLLRSTHNISRVHTTKERRTSTRNTEYSLPRRKVKIPQANPRIPNPPRSIPTSVKRACKLYVQLNDLPRTCECANDPPPIPISIGQESFVSLLERIDQPAQSQDLTLMLCRSLYNFLLLSRVNRERTGKIS